MTNHKKQSSEATIREIRRRLEEDLGILISLILDSEPDLLAVRKTKHGRRLRLVLQSDFPDRAVVFPVEKPADLPARVVRSWLDTDQRKQAWPRKLSRSKEHDIVANLENPVSMSRRLCDPASDDFSGRRFGSGLATRRQCHREKGKNRDKSQP